MTAGVHMEGHDGICLGRIPDEAVIDVDAPAQRERIGLCHPVFDIDRTMGFDLRQVLLINRIGDIGDGQERQIDVRHDAVQGPSDAPPYVRSQLAIDGYGPVLG